MIQKSPSGVNFRHLVTTLRQQWPLWVIPLMAMSLSALVYAVVRADTWEALQALHVRDETGSKNKRAGSFDDADSMKTAQETILEIAKNQQVLTAALAEVGPPQRRNSHEAWPSGAEIENMRGVMRISPPKGAELGRTEIIYLAVKDNDRQRAIALASAVCDQLEARLKELRSNKAQSIIGELERTQRLAQNDLDEATLPLVAMETEVGRDLGELRILNENGAGDSNLRSALNQIKSELRQVQTLHNTGVEQLKYLGAAQLDPNELVATPNRLLESQPALKRLKDGLVDAQLRTAELSANMSKEHPKVQAALAAEQLVRQDLHQELAIAIRGLSADLRVNESQIVSLEVQSADVTARLDRLAGLRARYANLVADVKQRTEILEKARKELSDARASQAAAMSVSLITRLDAPQTGNRPLAPGRKTIVLGGVAGGLLTGLGLVFLVTPLGSFRGRRLSDYLGFGRRASDMKRLADSPSPPRAGAIVESDRHADGFLLTEPAAESSGRRRIDDEFSTSVCVFSPPFAREPGVDVASPLGRGQGEGFEIATRTSSSTPTAPTTSAVPQQVLTLVAEEPVAQPTPAVPSPPLRASLSLAQSLSRLAGNSPTA